jgi:hypothetical protein
MEYCDQATAAGDNSCSGGEVGWFYHLSAYSVDPDLSGYVSGGYETTIPEEYLELNDAVPKRPKPKFDFGHRLIGDIGDGEHFVGVVVGLRVAQDNGWEYLLENSDDEISQHHSDYLDENVPEQWIHSSKLEYFHHSSRYSRQLATA